MRLRVGQEVDSELGSARMGELEVQKLDMEPLV